MDMGQTLTNDIGDIMAFIGQIRGQPNADIFDFWPLVYNTHYTYYRDITSKIVSISIIGFHLLYTFFHVASPPSICAQRILFVCVLTLAYR
jgi:hypothetical protein